MAQLRSGHSNYLAAYRTRLNPKLDPTCPHCGKEVETLEHFFQRCNATMAHRVDCFGQPSPPLSDLKGSQSRVQTYLQGLGLLRPLGGPPAGRRHQTSDIPVPYYYYMISLTLKENLL